MQKNHTQWQIGPCRFTEIALALEVNDETMKWILIMIVVTTVLADACSAGKNTQHTTAPEQDTTLWALGHRQPYVLDNYAAFVTTMQPVLDKMAGYQVVGLGEGTHGTSEFQTIRAFITRYLTEEKGFNIVCLENSYGSTTQLDRYIQTGRGNLDSLMHNNLLGMWQNREIRSMLQWMMQYNTLQTRKLHIAGMDYSSTEASSIIIKQVAANFKNPGIDSIASKLLMHARLMDGAYTDQNRGGKKYPVKEVFQNGVQGYETTIALYDALQKLAAGEKANVPSDTLALLQSALYNCKLTFYAIYKPVKEKKGISRDEIMAQMVKKMAEERPGSRIIVWAHNAHMAKKEIFMNGGHVGGTGAYLEKFFPGNYFVAGTGTAGGHFSATTDRFIVNTSRFKQYRLPAATDSSWEHMMAGFPNDHLFFDFAHTNSTIPKRTMRFTGYGPASAKDFIPVQPDTLFDGFFFVRTTRGTTMLW